MAALIAGMVGCGGGHAIEIQTWYDLDAIRDNLDGDYIMMNDLDSTTAGYEELASATANEGKGWEPIGTELHPFTGSFNGQGYEIRDLFINRPAEVDVGLFGYVGEWGVIEDVGVVNATATGNSHVGGLVGENWEGDVSNSYSTGNVTGNLGVGGLVGGNAGTVSNSYSSGNVTGLVGVGGLVGENGGAVSKSYATGNVTGSSMVGGLVGWNPGTVSNSFWDTDTSGQGSSDGGIGKTNEEMMDFDTFDGVGWDITTVDDADERNTEYIWNIIDDETYPFLSWQP